MAINKAAVDDLRFILWLQSRGLVTAHLSAEVMYRWVEGLSHAMARDFGLRVERIQRVLLQRFNFRKNYETRIGWMVEDLVGKISHLLQAAVRKCMVRDAGDL